jgi:BirA family transcriptional regulator, biotin operon repressor / biotin---[acetyl-CoA-carboxylase] ligase
MEMRPEANDRLNEEALRRVCEARGLNWRVRVLEETRSTNDWLRDEGRRREVAGEVVFAERQTAGRGRREHVWEGAAGCDLLFSLALKPAAPVVKWTRVTQLAALAVCRTVESELGLRAEIKWPNDVLIGGKKVCGILVESFGGREGSFLVAGVGLNVNATRYEGELAETATSLRLACGSAAAMERGLGRNGLAEALLASLAEALGGVEDEESYRESLEAVRERNAWLGRQVRMRVDGAERWGRVTGLTEEGALKLMTPEGEEEVVHSAEQVRLI